MSAAADLLRDARRRHGLSQRRLAFRAGVPQSTIGRIEAGVVDPGPGTLATILLGVGERLELRAVPLEPTSDPGHVARALRLSPTERLEQVVAFARFADDLREAGRRARG